MRDYSHQPNGINTSISFPQIKIGTGPVNQPYAKFGFFHPHKRCAMLTSNTGTDIDRANNTIYMYNY